MRSFKFDWKSTPKRKSSYGSETRERKCDEKISITWRVCREDADCSTKKADGTELYIVEGNSAGGSAKQARDSKSTSDFAAEGVEYRTGDDSKNTRENEEIKSLIMAIGAGLKESFEPEKLRYEKDCDHDRCGRRWIAY